MATPVPRFIRSSVMLAVIGALTVAVFHHWGESPTVPTKPDGWIQTPWGPLGPADRDLLVTVRRAELCVGSAGLQAQRQAGSAQVRTIGMRITTEYDGLDNQLRSVAAKLAVPLPTQPDTQQQGWMRELARLSGPSFDRTFAQRLRYAHGEMLGVIVDERVGTRNDLIRSFATTAAALVNRHLEDLERTGLVDYSTLPQPAPPTAGASPINTTQVNANPADGPEAVIAPMIDIAAMLGIVGLLYLLGNAGRRAPPSTDRARPSHRRQKAPARHGTPAPSRRPAQPAPALPPQRAGSPERPSTRLSHHLSRMEQRETVIGHLRAVLDKEQ